MSTTVLIPHELIERSILQVQGQRIMLDEDLAELYGVEIKVLNQAVNATIDDFRSISWFSLQSRSMPNARL